MSVHNIATCLLTRGGHPSAANDSNKERGKKLMTKEKNKNK